MENSLWNNAYSPEFCQQFTAVFALQQSDIGLATVRVPEQHVLMVSVPEIQLPRTSSCEFQSMLGLGVMGEYRWVTCGSVHPPVDLYVASDFQVSR